MFAICPVAAADVDEDMGEDDEDESDEDFDPDFDSDDEKPKRRSQSGALGDADDLPPCLSERCVLHCARVL